MAAFMMVTIGMHYGERAFWSLVGFIQGRLYPDVNGQVSAGGKGLTDLEQRFARNRAVALLDSNLFFQT